MKGVQPPPGWMRAAAYGRIGFYNVRTGEVIFEGERYRNICVYMCRSEYPLYE